MSIKYGLLCLLSEQDGYGYQLKTEFERRTGGTWPLNIGQVYTTLDRLVRDDLVERAGESDEGQVVYRIRDAGRDLVQRWFSSPVGHDAPPRDELAIKLALAVDTPGVDVAALVQTQRRAAMERLQDLMVVRRTAKDGDLAWSLVCESLVFSVEAEIRWLDHCESELTQASRHRDERAPAPSATSPTQSVRSESGSH